jgi:hypothetical protein
MEFYSYLWLRADGTPYYAGKGKGNRAFTGRGHNLRSPCDNARILVFPMASEAEAFESEMALIDLFGRKDLGTGCLRNLTSGGEGAAGMIVSAATRQKQSVAKKGKPSNWKGKKASLKTRKQQSESAKRRGCKLAGWNRGVPVSEKTKQKKSVAMKQFWATHVRKPISEETRQKMRQAKLGTRFHLGFKNSEESKQKMRLSALARRKREREYSHELERRP